MNINEIAKMAGVSRATVSRYLNQGYVSEEKKNAISQVIRDTGYEPSQQARNLRSKITKLIGVIIPRIQSESVSKMVAGISEVLSEEGYQLLLANTQNDDKEELKYLKLFRSNQVDGVLFMGTMFSKEHLKLMKELDVPIVIIGQEMENYSCVYQDDYQAGYQAAHFLLNKASHIGFIGVTAKDKAVGEARKRGFLDAMKDAGRTVADGELLESEFGVNGGYDNARYLLENVPLIDGIFCVTDSIAAGVLRYLHEKKIEVPKEIQLIGFGDTEMGSIVTPAITSVHFYYKTTGIEAAKLLLERLDTQKEVVKKIKMGFEIVEKNSTKKL